MEQPQPGQGAPQKGGFSFLKCCLIVGCIAVLIGGGVVGFGIYKAKQMFDPTLTAKTANEIVPCEIPVGYMGRFHMNIGGMRMAMIMPENFTQAAGAPGGIPLMIIMMSAPQKQTKQALEAQAKRQIAQSGGAAPAGGETEGGDAKVAKEEIFTIRGKPTKVEHVVQRDKQGNDMRQYTLVLEQPPTETNASGQELLMFMGSEKSFDKKAMEAFLSSIK